MLPLEPLNNIGAEPFRKREKLPDIFFGDGAYSIVFDLITLFSTGIKR
jgi:hypothetical protein